MASAIDLLQSHALLVSRLVEQAPLVHNITNFVVMNWTANVLLAAGASPAMVHAPEEAAEFAALSASLLINIGTLDHGFVAGMEAAAAKVGTLGTPWVLDPVGVGATAFRMKTAERLLAHRPTVIRANAGEIIALAGITGAHGRGVDSLAASEAAIEAGIKLATATGAVIAVTGATDYVITPETALEGALTPITGGAPVSQRVTGTGCAVSALVAAFTAIAPAAQAAVAALALMKVATEDAARDSGGPGSFAVALLDHLWQRTHRPTAGGKR